MARGLIYTNQAQRPENKNCTLLSQHPKSILQKLQRGPKAQVTLNRQRNNPPLTSKKKCKLFICFFYGSKDPKHPDWMIWNRQLDPKVQRSETLRLFLVKDDGKKSKKMKKYLIPLVSLVYFCWENFRLYRLLSVSFCLLD